MKIKLSVVFLGFILLVASSCNDDLNTVGGSIQPDGDGFDMFIDTFEIQASTVLIDSVFARTSSSILGHLYDPLYGSLESDFMCQFYIQDNFKFSKEPLNGVIDSMAFIMYYTTWIGDSITPMKASIYQVNEQLERVRYTNVNPEDFCKMDILLGEKSYTARDMTISDTDWNAVDSNTGLLIHTRKISIPMDRAKGQEFYDKSQSDSWEFKDQESFNKYFPGLYVKSTFGSGNLLDINGSQMVVYYQYRDTVPNKAGDGDTVRFNTYPEVFNVTKDVIQLNRVKNEGLEPLLADEEYTYIKSPSGVFTRLVIPAKAISDKIGERFINNMRLNLKATPQEKWDFALPAPGNLLILPEDSLASFFETYKTENSSPSYAISSSVENGSSISTEGYNQSTYTYYFGNLAAILKEHIKKTPSEDLRLLVVPVSRSVTQVSQSQVQTSRLENYLRPSGVKLRKDGNNMKIQVVSSKFK